MAKKPTDTAKVEDEMRVRRLEVTLSTLLIWMAGSAHSPLSRDEIQRLIDILEGHAESQAAG